MANPATALDVLANRAPWAVDVGDTRDWLKTLPDGSVHMCLTSPPYFGLRDYGTAQWEGGGADCDHKTPPSSKGDYPDSGRKQQTNLGSFGFRERLVCKKCGAVRKDSQIGLEQTPEDYVAALVDVFREVRRVIHPSGVMFLNLGDSFHNVRTHQGGGVPTNTVHRGGSRDGTENFNRTNRARALPGLKSKDLIGIPWLVAFALRADGWYLRQWLPWIKRNPMPESMDDRPGTACETIFQLTKSSDYFFDMEAVRVTSRKEWASSSFIPDSAKDKLGKGKTSATAASRNGRSDEPEETRNFRSADLWFDSVGLMMADDGTLLGLDVPTHPYSEAHFATYPERLVAPLVLAGTSAKGVCPGCGAPHERVVEKERIATRPGTDTKVTGDAMTDGNRDPERHVTRTKTIGWRPTCKCGHTTTVPAIVLDPFSGAGTTASVAVGRGRRAIGCELNPEYAEMSRKRIGATTTGFF